MNNAMTHFMEILANNQPWNLLFFMAIPVICAEMLAISELIVLYSRKLDGTARKINRITGIFAGVYFFAIFVFLMITAVIPLTVTGSWRGFVDVIAISFYLLGVIPFFGMFLLEMGFIGKRMDRNGKRKLHARMVGILLIAAHAAMLFGMLNPKLFLPIL